MSDDEDDDEEEEMDEQAVKDLQGFIAEPGEEVNDEILSDVFFRHVLFITRKKMRMQMNNPLPVNQKKMTKKSMMMI